MTREEIISEIEGVLEVGEGIELRIALRHAEAYIKNTEPYRPRGEKPEMPGRQMTMFDGGRADADTP